MWGYGISQTEDPLGFYGPRGIAVDNQGYVYVTDTGNKRVIVFDPDGQVMTQFGSEGFEPGQFNEPVGIDVDADGNVYVADVWNQRIQVFTSGSDWLFNPEISWDIVGWYGQGLNNYPYLEVDERGHVFATDPEGYRVLEFTSTGEFVQYWGDFGVSSDRFSLPNGIAVDPTGGVWVLDAESARAMHFTVPEK
jgi:sugar lactone lactonase YvrE